METPPKKRTVLGLLFATSFLELLGLSMAIPIFAPLFLIPQSTLLPADMSMEMRNILYGAAIAAYPIAQFFGTPVLGALSDRHGRKPLLLFSRVGTLVSYLIIAFAIHIGNLPLIFLARLFDGFTGGNISVAQSAIADVSHGREKSRNFGLIGMAFGLGFIVGPVLGGVFSDASIVPWFSFATPFWIASALTAANIVLVQRMLPETLHQVHVTAIHPLQGFANIIHALTHPFLKRIFLVTLLYIFGFNFFTQYFQVFLVHRFSYDQGDIGYMFGYMGLWVTIAQGVTNRWAAHRFDPQNILAMSLLLLGLTLPLLLISPHHALLYLILPFVANFQGLSMPNLVTIISDSAPPHQQGRTLGMQQSVQAIGMALPPLLAGFLSAIHLAFPILAASACIFAAWLLYMLTVWRHIPPAHEGQTV